jgi:putative copper export protein
MPFAMLLSVHLLGAAIWTGGHLVLATGVLPDAWRRRDPEPIRRYEAAFERIGLPALVMQVITGVWMSLRYVPGFSGLFAPQTAIAWLILAKLGCLLVTLALAVHARRWLIPKLSPETLPTLGWHILAVTTLSVVFTLAGGLIRCGGW